MTGRCQKQTGYYADSQYGKGARQPPSRLASKQRYRMREEGKIPAGRISRAGGARRAGYMHNARMQRRTRSGSARRPGRGGDPGMSHPSHRKGNDVLRTHIPRILSGYEVGQKIKTVTILSHLQKVDGRYELNPTRIGRLLRERDDLRWVQLGVWEKIAEVPEVQA